MAEVAMDDMRPMFLPLPLELEALLASGELTPKMSARGDSSTPPVTFRPPPGLISPATGLKKNSISSESSPSGCEESQPPTPLAAHSPQRLSSNKMLPICSKGMASGPEGVVMSVIGDMLSCRELAASSTTASSQSLDTSRWWTQSSVLCPLTGFPISLLPYPPFKLRVDPKKPRPHTLVDGKFLAMQVIVDENFIACNRALKASDIAALDDYVHRCKLGPFRPGQALAYKQEAEKAESEERRSQASEDLDRLLEATAFELSKLRRIQENRMRQMSKGQTFNDQGAASGSKGTRSDISRRRRVRTY